ncbi:ladinin-1 isoform X2 [Sceloporus undulatus]|nr:ladinin-1 isoform X2 [Sceloporus undulatus]
MTNTNSNTVQAVKDQNSISQMPNRFRNSSETKPLKLWSSKLENDSTLVDVINKQEDNRVRRRVEMFNNANQDKKETVSVKKLEKKTTELKAKTSSEPAQEQKCPIVEKYEGRIEQKDILEEKQQNMAQGKKGTTLEVHKNLGQEEDTLLEKHGNLDQEEKECHIDQNEVFREEQKTLNSHVSPRLTSVQNEVATKEPQRTSWERKSISRLEVKIQPRVRNFIEASVTTSASGPQATERNIPKLDNEAESSVSGQAASEVPLLGSRPLITYSSSFKRITPRTISFRVVSRKDKQDDALSRSASMRLPANTAKLEEKLEKYTSAVQRAGSIKLPPSARRNFQPLSEGVASKRSIFEASVPSQAEPVTLARKESLKIPGGVTSRINLWISRTQEPGKDEGTKDIRRTVNTTQRSQWGKQSDDS